MLVNRETEEDERSDEKKKVKCQEKYMCVWLMCSKKEKLKIQ
jgi:hypothetical protein